jgi:hypothetical protein
MPQRLIQHDEDGVELDFVTVLQDGKATAILATLTDYSGQQPIVGDFLINASRARALAAFLQEAFPDV